MAVKSGRDPIFTLSAEGEIQEGKYSLTTPPESGIHPDTKNDIADDLLSGNAVIDLVTDRLAADLKTRKSISKDRDRIIKAAKRVLIRAEGKYYLQVEQVSKKNIKIIQELYDTYPDISIIELAEDDDFAIEDEENEVFGSLNSFITSSRN